MLVIDSKRRKHALAKFTATAICCLPVTWVSALNLSDVPLFLSGGAEPNLVITIDDSQSMRWGYVPANTLTFFQSNNLSWRSPEINPIAYNPDIEYRPALDYRGISLGNGGLHDGGIGYSPEADFNAVYESIFKKTLSDRGTTVAGYNDQVVNLATAFTPLRTMSSNLNTREYNPGMVTGPAHYTRLDVSNAGCDSATAEQRRDDDDCYDTVIVSATSGPLRERPELDGAVSADERTNFANWYQFYASRMLAAQSAVSLTYTPSKLPNHIRVASQSMTANTRNADTVFVAGNEYPGPRSGNRNGSQTGGDPFLRPIGSGAGSEREHFYDWLYGMTTRCCTPIPRSMQTVGDFFSQTGVNSAYIETPGTGGKEVSCRVNAHITVTDGSWTNAGTEPPNIAGLVPDDAALDLPDGKAYRPDAGDHHIFAYTDTQFNLSDMSFNFWATDLRPDLENNVPIYMRDGNDYWNPKNDPADWQHMVNYTVSFGVAGNVPLDLDENDLDVYQQLLAGDAFTNESGELQTGWTPTATRLGRGDDLYHAAINSRGEYFSATAPQELVESLASVINSISDRDTSASSVDVNSGSISADVGVFQARFDSGEWTGDLTVAPISDGVSGGRCNSLPAGSLCPVAWRASELNTETTLDWNKRAIYSYRPDLALGNRGVPFRWGAGLNATQKNWLEEGIGTLGFERLEYIRGNSANEQRNNGIFRSRSTSRVGAFVHSSPLYVSNGFQANGRFGLVYPDDIEQGNVSHRDFVCTNPVFDKGVIQSCSSGTWSRPPLVYVGGNDGMLHAYDGGLDGGGRELFAYLPNISLENLSEITRPSFTAGSSVDGQLTSGDVFSNGAWRTVLLGGLRTGGQGYFALDITDPKAFGNESDANANRLALWEFTDDDLGYTYGPAQIVKSNDESDGSNGRWVAVFGNGYNATEADGSASLTGRAYLYVVDISTGTIVRKIDTQTGTLAEPNSIASVTPVFDDSGLTIDYVYAGDIQGNLWKFDLRSKDPSKWDVAYQKAGTPQPLFTADEAITGTPKVGGHPLGGNLVYFGTGKYLESSDNTTTDQNRFYGLWDKNRCAPQSNVNGSCATSRNLLPSAGRLVDLPINKLQQQTILQTTASARVTSDSQVDWNTQHGWYIDLVSADGERAVGKPVLRGPLVLFTSVVPDGDQCSAGGSSWLYALNRINGSRAPTQVFDRNRNGQHDLGDLLNGEYTSATLLDGIVNDAMILSDGQSEDHAIYGLPGGATSEKLDLHLFGNRVRWRQIH